MDLEPLDRSCKATSLNLTAASSFLFRLRFLRNTGYPCAPYKIHCSPIHFTIYEKDRSRNAASIVLLKHSA